MDVLNLKIKASTLIEIIVASIIIVLILFIGLTIFSSIHYTLFHQLKNKQAIEYSQSIFNTQILDKTYHEKYHEYDIFITKDHRTNSTQDFFITITHKKDTIWNVKRTLIKR